METTGRIWAIIYSYHGWYEEFGPVYMMKWGAFKTYAAACEEALNRFNEEKNLCHKIQESRILDGLFEFKGDGVEYRFEVVGLELKG